MVEAYETNEKRKDKSISGSLDFGQDNPSPLITTLTSIDHVTIDPDFSRSFRTTGRC